MESLVFVWPPTAIGTVRLVLLVLPLAVTSLNIGLQELRRRGRKVHTEGRLAGSLAVALDSGVLEFQAQPRDPCINVFAHDDDDEESDMQLVLSPRSLVRSKSWFSDKVVPPEPETRIVRVYMLGPGSDSPSTAEAKQDEPLLLSVAPESSLQPEPLQKLATFFGLCPAPAEPMRAVLCMTSMARNADRHFDMTSWNNRQEAAPEIERMAPPVFPSTGFQPQRLQVSPPMRGCESEQSGFVAATAIAGAAPVPCSPVNKELPVGNFAVFSAQASGVAEPLCEPFLMTPPMCLPRTWFDRDAWPKRSRKTASATNASDGSSNAARVVYVDFRANKPVPRSARNLKWGR